MLQRRKLAMIAATGALVVGTMVAGALAAPQVTLAAPMEHRGAPGVAGPGSDSYLAEALGITAEALSEAQETARVAAIDQALEKGLITQAQADALKQNQRSGGRGGMIPFRGTDEQIDHEALLADALGISVEKLEEAQKAAADARLAQAVKDGRITQEQADQMKAEQALQSYIQEKGFFADAVKEAVADGVITQAQADAILSRQGPGMWGFDKGGFGGHGGRGGLERPATAPEGTASGA